MFVIKSEYDISDDEPSLLQVKEEVFDQEPDNSDDGTLENWVQQEVKEEALSGGNCCGEPEEKYDIETTPSHEAPVGYECSNCNEVFELKQSLELHIYGYLEAGSANRNGVVAFQCQKCRKTFCRKRDFIHHRHNNSKSFYRFRCSVCRRGYSRRKSLLRHALTHHFRCIKCDRSFRRKALLDQHVCEKTGN